MIEVRIGGQIQRNHVLSIDGSRLFIHTGTLRWFRRLSSAIRQRLVSAWTLAASDKVDPPTSRQARRGISTTD